MIGVAAARVVGAVRCDGADRLVRGIWPSRSGRTGLSPSRLDHVKALGAGHYRHDPGVWPGPVAERNERGRCTRDYRGDRALAGVTGEAISGLGGATGDADGFETMLGVSGYVGTRMGIPVEGMVIILGVDRLLDMCRTAVNATRGLWWRRSSRPMSGKTGPVSVRHSESYTEAVRAPVENASPAFCRACARLFQPCNTPPGGHVQKDPAIAPQVLTF